MAAALAGAIAWGTFVLAPKSKGLSTVGVLALVLVSAAAGISFAIAVASQITNGLGKQTRTHREQIDGILRHRLHALAAVPDKDKDKQLTANELATISLHVWEVSRMYRQLNPFGMRQRARKWLPFLGRFAWRYAIDLAAACAVGRCDSSGVNFKRGYGLVGNCVAGEANQFVHVDFASREFRTALALGKGKWESKDAPKITYGLSYKDALTLSHKYQEAIAMVIADPTTHEPIGCITMETTRGSSVRLGGPRARAARAKHFHNQLRDCVELLDRTLAMKGVL